MRETMKKPEKLYQFHVENLRAVAQGFSDVVAAGRSAVAKANDQAISTHIRLAALLLGAWAECRLLKLLYEPNTFDDVTRAELFKQKAFDRWMAVIEMAFRRHYNIPKAALQPPALKPTAFFRYQSLRSALDQHARPIITMRNKLAHGQWAFPLNDERDDVAQEQMDALRNENLFALKQKMKLIDAVCAAVHDLSVSLPTFDRDWDKHFGLVEQIRTNLVTRPYETWAQQVRDKSQRGQARRMAAASGG
jgi:hypothetical protein